MHFFLAFAPAGRAFSPRAPLLLLAALLLALPAFAEPAKAAVTMESGERTISLPPKQEEKNETDGAPAAAPGLFGGGAGEDSTMTTPQRPAEDDAANPEPLPFGIAPEVHVPWFPPGRPLPPPPGTRPPRPGVTPLYPDGSSTPGEPRPPQGQLRPQGHLPPAATLP